MGNAFEKTEPSVAKSTFHGKRGDCHVARFLIRVKKNQWWSAIETMFVPLKQKSGKTVHFIHPFFTFAVKVKNAKT